MSSIFPLFIVLTIFTGKAFAQQEEQAVKQAVTSFFDAMRHSDSTRLKAAFSPTAIMQTIVVNKAGERVVHTEQVEQFISAVTRPHPEVYDERIQFDVVRVDADLAIAWTPYQFYVGNQFSHCGVNSFQLVRLNGVWKIQYIIDTRRKEDCGG
ncbi:MAG: nuclear transport factor 2 family protein [Flavisolibacter sp.]|nr:nuclear transport factor 2 family protein [Flavisolibacter sp.]